MQKKAEVSAKLISEEGKAAILKLILQGIDGEELYSLLMETFKQRAEGISREGLEDSAAGYVGKIRNDV